MDSFTRSYIEAALWSSTDDRGEPLDRKYSAADVSEQTLRQMHEDCEAFMSENIADLVQRSLSRGGHDFWLTRNRHGAGFWDGDWPKDAARRLTDSAHAYGSMDLYVGADGKIYGG